MCGIFVSAICSTDDDGDADSPFQIICSKLRNVNALRGPDAQTSCCLKLSIDKESSSLHSDLNLELHASELRLRGTSPVVQPHVKDDNILCWNGEIFEGVEIAAEENDGLKLAELLCSLQTSDQIRELLGTIEGPYAFAFYHATSEHLYFARDPLGRRSLLIHKPTTEMPYLLLSSVSDGRCSFYEFSELSSQSIFVLDIGYLRRHENIVDNFAQALAEIPRTNSVFDSTRTFAEVARVNPEILPEPPRPISLDDIPGDITRAAEDLVKYLDRSVMLRVRDIPSYPLSMNAGKGRVAVLFSGGIDSTVIAYLAHRHIPLDQPIDLLNVAFENPRKIRIQQEGNFGSVSKRRSAKSKSESPGSESNHELYEVPDRITGKSEVEELRQLCPGRTWNFVEVNVPYKECQAAQQLVEALMVPGRSVMDLSLALALYFASRGKGQIRHEPDLEPIPYTSDARVLLNGFGSDELLGGYGRHRSVYNSGGWKAAVSELQQEIDRIPTRNLGRDDRVISSHGKETRHPFLSLPLVSFVASLPIHYKMDPRLDLGFGDKMLLRVAAKNLGLLEASTRKKRAMQFGSRSARMNGERRGDVELE